MAGSRGDAAGGAAVNGHRVIIDTDPGQDDAVAILLALASPEIEVLGITTVAGNVPLPLTTRNALQIVELAGRTEVPVHAGAAHPLVRPLVTAEEVHGQTGLDGPDLPEPTLAPRDGARGRLHRRDAAAPSRPAA